MTRLTILVWKWRPRPGYRSTFTAQCVNVLARSVARHYPHDHEVVCVTDEPDGLDPAIRTVALPPEYADLPNWKGDRFPSCYRRLRVFAADAADWLGAERVLSLDLDVVITADCAPLWRTPEDFRIWGEGGRRTPYNGSMYLLTLGARPTVWSSFIANPTLAIRRCQQAGYVGSDQAHIAVALGQGEARWTRADGVFSYRNDIRDVPGRPLPAGARVVPFHGHLDPWDDEAQQLAWVREHWR